MKAPKFRPRQDTPPAPSLNELRNLSPEALAEHAQKLGTTPEKLSAIVAGGIEKKKEREKVDRADREFRDTFFKENDKHLPQLRTFLLSLRVTPEQLERAEVLLEEADAQFDQPGMAKIVEDKFWEAEEYRTRDLLLEKAKNTSSVDALAAFEAEMKERIRVTNIPPHVDALRAMLDSLANGFRKNNFGEMDIQGTPVHVESEGGLLYPKNPRPRRYNDDLEHY